MIVLLLAAGMLFYFYRSNTTNAEVKVVADIFCATFQARAESGLGKPIIPSEPTTVTSGDAAAHGAQFQQKYIEKLTLVMAKYKWNSGDLQRESNKASDLMKSDSFVKKSQHL